MQVLFSGGKGRRRRLTRPVSLALAAATVAALGFVAAGATLARFSTTQTSGSNSLAAGTVTLSDSAISGCPVSGLLPDDTASACTFTATYSGPVSAYLALDVLIETQPGSGGSDLYNPADAGNDLQVSITSAGPAVSYTVPTTATGCPGSAPSGSTCYELDDELVSVSAVTSASVTFTASVLLPASSTSGYQGGTAQIIMTAHAVQSANNGLSCAGGSPSAGSPCPAAGSFEWS